MTTHHAGTKPVRMTYGFVIRSMLAGTNINKPTVADLVNIARTMPEVFPDGLTRDDARHMLDNPNNFTDGEP